VKTRMRGAGARARWLGAVLALLGCAAYGAEPTSTAFMQQAPKWAWPTHGGNLFQQRYSPLVQITGDNVARLRGRWHTHLNGSGVGVPYSAEATPLVHDGVLYVVTGAHDVFALDVATGAIKWVYQAGLDPLMTTVCCGWTSRGLALGEGELFLGRLDGHLLALDIESGKPLWDVQAERWQDGFTITGAPLYVDGLVVTGFAGAEYGVRGRVKAYSATDGKLVWTFYTIPAPGEPGHDTWPADSDIWQRGGATMWHTPAVDPELGLLYFATGNPGPDFNGAVRGGDNLYANSIVALETKTGAYRWHFQEVHHDIWDYDASNPVVLFDVAIDGRPRKGLAQAGKTGWVYILDRVTGAPLIGIDELPVPQEPRQKTAATQPYPRGDAFVPQALDMPLYGSPLVNGGRIFTPFWDQPVALKPSSFGGTTWAPPSYDPINATLYICAIDRAGLFKGGDDQPAQPGKLYLGGEFLFARTLTGVFAAIDVRTNRLRWQQRWDDKCYSGSVATAGQLVFTGMNDGRLVALDTRDGRALWEFQTGAGVNAPPIVFEHDGQQVVAVYAGGSLFANSPPGDSVWLFALDGALEALPAPGGPAPPLHYTDGDASAGHGVYSRYCAQCHGAEGDGGHGGGPSLKRGLPLAQVAAVVFNGRNAMPALRAILSADQIRDVATYVARGLKAD